MNTDYKDNSNVLEAMDSLVEFLKLEPNKKDEKFVDENGTEYRYLGSAYLLWDLRENNERENSKDYPVITPKELLESEPLDYPHALEKVLYFESETHQVSAIVSVNQDG